jgi:hypothetical protein
MCYLFKLSSYFHVRAPLFQPGIVTILCTVCKTFLLYFDKIDDLRAQIPVYIRTMSTASIYQPVVCLLLCDLHERGPPAQRAAYTLSLVQRHNPSGREFPPAKPHASQVC